MLCAAANYISSSTGDKLNSHAISVSDYKSFHPVLLRLQIYLCSTPRNTFQLTISYYWCSKDNAMLLKKIAMPCTANLKSTTTTQSGHIVHRVQCKETEFHHYGKNYSSSKQHFVPLLVNHGSVDIIRLRSNCYKLYSTCMYFGNQGGRSVWCNMRHSIECVCLQ